MSVIVSSRNAANVITEQLDAIHAQLCDGDEMIVIDDASTDDTAEVVCRWHRRHNDRPVSVVRALTQGGPNASRNAGTAFASRELLAFTDGDDVVCSGWLDALRSTCAHNTLVAGVYYRNGDGPAVSPSTMFGYPLVLGSSMAMERRVVETVGGFDENILRGGTESEFALRAQIALEVDVVVAHGAAITYRDPVALRRRMTKVWSRAKGHAYVATRYRQLPNINTSIVFLRPSLFRSLATALIRLVAPRRGIPRSAYVLSICNSVPTIVWLVVYRLRMPGERRLRPNTTSRYRMLVQPHSSKPGAVSSHLLS